MNKKILGVKGIRELLGIGMIMGWEGIGSGMILELNNEKIAGRDFIKQLLN